MIARERLRIAIQKSGRLSEKSLALFEKCGLQLDFTKDRLLHSCANFPVDFMLVRDDDIPEYVADDVCDWGIVGKNVIEETGPEKVETIQGMGFGKCRLSIATPDSFLYDGPSSLDGKRIATSYPNCLKKYLDKHGIRARVIQLKGSVEIATGLDIADVICDLISTGATLRSNGLRERDLLFESEALLVRTKNERADIIQQTEQRLLQRMNGVMNALQSKYIMMNANASSLPQIKEILPGMESPSIINLDSRGEKIAIHAVATEGVFWETIEKLKELGASSILVLPIEKIII